MVREKLTIIGVCMAAELGSHDGSTQSSRDEKSLCSGGFALQAKTQTPHPKWVVRRRVT
jgi:hypothetical protein